MDNRLTVLFELVTLRSALPLASNSEDKARERSKIKRFVKSSKPV